MDVMYNMYVCFICSTGVAQSIRNVVYIFLYFLVYGLTSVLDMLKIKKK